jgi:ABC-type phosphate transport system substrate-binding protein
MKNLAAAVFLASLPPPASSQPAISVHGSGTTNPSKCYWQIMDQMQFMAKLPVRMTYRGVGSSVGQAEFIGNITHSDSMFGSGDIPLSTEDYSLFPEDSIFHLPIVLGSIGFFHSVPVGDQQLNLSPCILAKIFNRKITDWSDAEIMNDNHDLVLSDSTAITVARRVQGSSSTASITAYLHQVCPEEWPAEMVGSVIEWPADTVGCDGSSAMTDCITGTPGTIGYIESGHGHAEGLQEIELLNSAQTFINSKEAAEKGGIVAAVENAVFPDSLHGDFSSVNLLNQVCVCTLVRCVVHVSDRSNDPTLWC